MSRSNKSGRNVVERATEFLVEEDLRMPDEELLREFTECGGDPDQLAADMVKMFEATVLKVNKSKLVAAKAGVAALRPLSQPRRTIDAAEARRRLRTILSSPSTPQGLTMAARNESELSDADVLGMLEDLRELGLLPEDDAT